MSKNLYKFPLYMEHRSISDIKDLIKTSIALHADKPAFLVKKDSSDYQPITYKEMGQDIDAFGTALLDMGLSGKKVAVIGENSYEWAIAYLAVCCGVGIIVPMDKDLPAEEIQSLSEFAEIDAIIYSDKVKEKVASAGISIKISMGEIPSVIEKGKALLKEGKREYLDASIDKDVLSVLLFTSGTTGSAKGVMLSHKNIASNIENMAKMINMKPASDVFLAFLPFHHTYECTCGFLCALYLGDTTAFCEGLRYVTKNLVESQTSVLLGVPLVFENMYNKIWKQAEKQGKAKKLRAAIKVSNALLKLGIDLRKVFFKDVLSALGGNMKIMISGAAAIDPKVSQGFRDFGIMLLQGYGLTECAPIAALNRDKYFKDEAAGLPLPGTEIKIVDKDENGIGEILIKGENVTLGYFKNEEATKETIKDGWYCSGDLGYLDKDGFLCITGRKKNVIVTKNGKNIFPEELETYLLRSPYIKEAMVYGVEKENDTEIAVQIFPEEAELQNALPENYSEEDVFKLMQEEVLKVNHAVQTYKRIAKIEIRDKEFIKTSTQKIKRYQEIKNLDKNIK